jgi:hypothetical protein
MMNECEGDMFLATITLINFIAVSGSLTSKKDLDKNKPTVLQFSEFLFHRKIAEIS